MPKLNNESLLDGAECARLTPEEANRIFFQENPNNPGQDLRGVRKTEAAEAARSMCRKCPVLAECLKYALENPKFASHGVWGGMSEGERKRILRMGESEVNRVIKSAGK